MNAGGPRGHAIEGDEGIADRDLALRKNGFDFTADHEANQFGLGDVGHFTRADGLTVAEHRHTVGQRGSSSRRCEM
jgi:hypothetical protein